jgi:hypothetical protein
MTNEPSGFKSSSYRYRATSDDGWMTHIDLSGATVNLLANDPSQFMRQLASYETAHEARGGLVPA